MMNSSPLYEIRVRGHLDSAWATWLDNVKIENRANGEAVLTVPVSDQAALHGLLDRVFALNLGLIAVSKVLPEPRPEPLPGKAVSGDMPNTEEQS